MRGENDQGNEINGNVVEIPTFERRFSFSFKLLFYLLVPSPLFFRLMRLHGISTTATIAPGNRGRSPWLLPPTGSNPAGRVWKVCKSASVL